MNILLVQIVLAQRNEDVEGWSNILVVVLLAVFWALGGIIKARKQQQAAQNRSNLPPVRKPARRPTAQTATLREQLLRGAEPSGAAAERRVARPGFQDARTRLAEWRTAARKFAQEAEQAFRAQMETAAPPPELPPHVPVRPKSPFAAYETPQVASKPSTTPEEHPALMMSEQTQAEYLTDLLADYSDSDQLRRAILHYEILGKPLSLREPNESGMEF